MVMITLYAKQKKRHRHTDRLLDSVGEGEGRMFRENSIETCILSIVKQITSPGWIHETSARAWCTGKTQRYRIEREVGGGIGMGNNITPWLIHVNVWQNPLQYCKVISLQLIKINEKKEKYTERLPHDLLYQKAKTTQLLMGPEFWFRKVKNSGDGWWWILYNNVNVLSPSELYS